jgi:uncharacterized protein YkwD
MSIRQLASAAAVAGAVAASMSAPQASASPDGDLFKLINAKHVAAGCAPYGPSTALGDVSMQYAQALASNNGKLSPNTVALLQKKGYDPSYWGEMDYYNSKGATPQNALDFWLNNPTKDLFGNCDITQMAVSVWIIGNNWAASSIMGTPKGAATPGGSGGTPGGTGGTPSGPPAGSTGGPDAALLSLINDARVHPEKYPPHGAPGVAKMTGCATPFTNSSALAGTASAHNNFIATMSKDVVNVYPNMHKTAGGGLAGDAGGPIEQVGYHTQRGQIVADGFGTEAAAVQFWMQDDAPSNWGHRNLILDCGLTDAGAAHLAGGPLNHYWTVDMGTT